MIITVCTFKRTADAVNEYGIMLDEDQVIIDKSNKKIAKVYDYILCPHLGCITLNLPEPFIKGVVKSTEEN